MSNKENYQPISGMDLPRNAGISTFMRLPNLAVEDAQDVEIGLFGLPWDGGTTTRNGSRYGPRQIREMSTLLRGVNPETGRSPYDLANCADLGDAPFNPVDPMQSLDMIEQFAKSIISQSIAPLAFGGDHLVSLPMLRAVAQGRVLGLIHFDAHTDMYDSYYGDSKFTHGTPFRRAVEEGLIDPKKIVQIGIRGTIFASDEYEWTLAQGVTHIGMDELRDNGWRAAVEKIREIIGDHPSYLTFDIDAIDPSAAPGTGVPEIGGITPYEAQKMLRGLVGLNIIGGDFVEVSPPIDQSGNTALVAANLSFEILCLIAETVAQQRQAQR